MFRFFHEKCIIKETSAAGHSGFCRGAVPSAVYPQIVPEC